MATRIAIEIASGEAGIDNVNKGHPLFENKLRDFNDL